MPELSQEQFDDLNNKAKRAEVLESEKTKLEKDLEDTRLEVLSPEYTKFLESLEKGGDKDKAKAKADDKPNPEDDELAKLTPRQLFERAKKELRDEINQDFTKKELDQKEREVETNKRAIAKFKAEHADFEEYRPVMYGLSKDPKNSDMTLAELYNAAKSHVKTIKTGSSDDQKDKSRRSSSERPGNDTLSFDKIKKMSNAELNRSALDEVKAELGPIPAA